MDSCCWFRRLPESLTHTRVPEKKSANVTIMKFQMSLLLMGILAVSVPAISQTKWKPISKENGMIIYEGKSANSSFKSVKVECIFEGTFDKLLSELTNVHQHPEWVYNNKSASLLKKVSPSEFYYYSETSLPWPLSNRDAILHTTIRRDSLNRFLMVRSVAEAAYAPEKAGKVRIRSSNVNWYVTMPSVNTIHIVYTLEVDPGGNVPAWLVNSFVEKGPYESFKKLKSRLRQ